MKKKILTIILVTYIVLGHNSINKKIFVTSEMTLKLPAYLSSDINSMNHHSRNSFKNNEYGSEEFNTEINNSNNKLVNNNHIINELNSKNIHNNKNHKHNNKDNQKQQKHTHHHHHHQHHINQDSSNLQHHHHHHHNHHHHSHQRKQHNTHHHHSQSEYNSDSNKLDVSTIINHVIKLQQNHNKSKQINLQPMQNNLMDHSFETRRITKILEYNDDASLDMDYLNDESYNNEMLESDMPSQLLNSNSLNKIHVDSYNSKPNSDNIDGIKCPKCTGSTNKVHVSQEQLNELRIDFVKKQILQKLRLKDPPQVTAMDSLPKPITEMEYQSVKSKENLDDYYARTSKKFIILQREYDECARFNKNPAICFSFKIDDVDVDSIDVNQAVLWLYKKRSHKEQMKQTLVVSEIEQQQMNSKYLPKIKPIAMTSVGVEEKWIKVDIAWPIRKWVGIHELSHLIHISCESCELDSNDGLIALEKEFQPFIVIDTQYRRQRHRQKRSVNCTAGVTECCREKLYISFKDIGWSDWIIHPTGYNAYFCRGSCGSEASIAASNYHHTSIIKTLKDKFDRPLELIPCCTAKQFSSLELFYRDSNNTVTVKTLPNMVVESCGCM